MSRLVKAAFLAAVFLSSMCSFLLGAWFAYTDGVLDGMCHVVNSMSRTFDAFGGRDALKMCEGSEVWEGMIR